MMRCLLAVLALLCCLSARAEVCPGAQWELAEPATTGWDHSRLRQAGEVAATLDTTALVVVHRGRIIFEYGRPAQPIQINSARKSILSLLFGIADDRGQTQLDATLAELGMDDDPPLSLTEKTATVRQLLAARSCIYHRAASETAAMKSERPPRGSCQPGERWFYNNWDFNALGAIYARFAGQDVYRGLWKELVQPLGFEDFDPALNTRWLYDPASRYPAYHMDMSARDLARVGLLMLRGGDWCGRRIVSRRWVDESTAPISSLPGKRGIEYGYMWWVGDKGVHFANRFPGKVFSARGSRGQILLVDVADDLVIAHLVGGRGDVSNADFGRIVRPILEALPR